MNALGLDVTSVGNHEFDEGVTELLRLQNGGCHPVDGCQDGDGFAGATFPYLAANVVDKKTHCRSCCRCTIEVRRRRAGRLRRHDARGHPGDRQPGRHHHASTSSTRSRPPTTTPTCSASSGVHVAGAADPRGRRADPPPARPTPTAAPASPATSPPIVAGLRPDYGVVVSRPHAPVVHLRAAELHRRELGRRPAPARSAAWSPTSRSRSTSRPTQFVSASAHNVIVDERHPEPGRHLADGRAPATSSATRPWSTPTPRRSPTSTAPRWRRWPTGSSARSPPTSPVTTSPQRREPRSATSSPTRSSPTPRRPAPQIALMNPGGIRATSLTFDGSPGGEAPGQVTYGEGFTVQPFNNLVVTQTLTGAQIKAIARAAVRRRRRRRPTRILQVSAGLHLLLRHHPAGSAAGSATCQLNGVPIDSGRDATG